MTRESSPPASEGARERLGPDGGLAEILKRVIEAGARNLSPEGRIRQAARDLKLPREAISFAFSQLDETKSGLYKAVAGELRQFLENSNLGDELARALTKLTFEVKMQVRFVPSENKPRPKVATQVRVRASEDDEPTASEPAEAPVPTEPAAGAGNVSPPDAASDH